MPDRNSNPSQIKGDWLEQNRLPINQQAKAALKKLDKEPDPGILYLVQLMDCGLEHPDLEWSPDLKSRLQAQVDVLKGADPKVAMNWLLPEGEGLELPAEAVDAAKAAVDHLDSRMSAQVANYPPPGQNALLD